MPSARHFDVIVIGVGSMGSATCYHLAAGGAKVLGLEQFDIVHEHGSHFGQSRIIRKAYFEHPDYVPLLQRSYDNWRKLEAETQTDLYHQTGIVYFGRPDHPTMEGVKTSAAQHKVPVEKISSPVARKQFEAFNIPHDFEILFEREAGFITPEKTIRVYDAQARQHGATINTFERVTNWKADGMGMRVTTDKASYICDRLVITAGSWTAKLIPQLHTSLHVTRQTLAWVNPKSPGLFALGNFPCWFIEDPDRGMFYGFPVLPFEKFGGPIGLKLASHKAGETADPDRVPRVTTDSEEDDLRFVLSTYLPAAGDEIISLKTCLYTHSPDENFIIDHLPGYESRVTIACGFSGHGFKFVPVVGEILADLAMKGRTELPIEFLRLNRF